MWKLLVCAALAAAESLDVARAEAAPLWRRGGELQVPIANDLAHQRYLVNVSVGTPPQHFRLLVDTGSTDVWVASANSTGCAPNCPPNTFDPARSSTYKPTGELFNATYGLTPDLQVTGPYFTDTLCIGDAVIPHMTGDKNNPCHRGSRRLSLHRIACARSSSNASQLGFGNVPPEIYDAGIFGILGLGARRAEAIYRNPSSPYYQNYSGTFPTIYDQLLKRGYIHRRLFSIWQNEQSAPSGTLLFGGIDESRYHGELKYVPLDLASGQFTDWRINLTSVSIQNDGNSTPLTPSTFPLAVTMDTGSPNMYVPVDLANAVAQDLNATMQQGFPYVDCAQRQSTKSLVFDFDGSSSQGPRIVVPYGEIIYPFGDPANVGNVTGSDGTKLCYLGLIGTEAPIALLGDTFQRSAYMVFDVDNKRVGMAPARYGSR